MSRNIALAKPLRDQVHDILRAILPPYLATRLLWPGFALVVLAISQGDWSVFRQTNSWINLWAKWDSTYYLTIADTGYTTQAANPKIAAFFPLYSFFLRFFSGGSESREVLVVAGIILSFIFTLIALALLFHLVTDLHNRDIALITIWLICLFPTSYYFNAVYTESLFLLLAVFSFWAAQRNHWWLANLGAAAIVWCRVPGLAVAGALSLSWIWDRLRHDDQRSILPLLLPPLSLAGLLLFEWVVLGDPLAFLNIQSEWGRQTSVLSAGTLIQNLFTEPLTTMRSMGSSVDLIFTMIPFLCLWFIWKRQPLSHTFYICTSLIITLATLSFGSMPRYVIVMFPIFIAIAQFEQVQKWRWGIYCILFCLQLWFFARWTLGAWIA